MEEMSKLFPIFILSILALITVPWTLYRVVKTALSSKNKIVTCSCSLCARSPKNIKSVSSRIFAFFSFTNIVLILLWITISVLMYYIQLISIDIEPFEPFSILGLSVGASDSEIKKAYYRLSRQYHPDKNPDPAANKYFVDFISKAYQALTDEVARKNLEEYGHPDGRQAMNVGIALPKFMLDIKGHQGGILLVGLVGVGILLPLLIIVIYLSNSSKYTGNNIMHQTLINYYHLIKPSLAPSKVMDVLTKAAEFLEMKVKRSDEASLQQLFLAVRGELIPKDSTNLKQEQAKFWKRHPALVKAELLLLAQICREGAQISEDLKPDFTHMLNLLPRLLEELMKMSVIPRTMDHYGWLRPAVGVMELSQCIFQAVPLSARKASERSGHTEGIAAFLQLPHFDDSVVKKIARKKIRNLQELRDLTPSERGELYSFCSLSSSEASDVEACLSVMPTIKLESSCFTEGESGGIQEGDVVTFQAWASVRRQSGDDASRVLPHCPFFPFAKEELYWILLADAASNNVWVSQRVTFSDEEAAIAAAAKLVREMEEGLGRSDAEVKAAVAEAVARVRSGARLVASKFQAPSEGSYSLTAFCMSDVWIGCDSKVPIKMKVAKRTRAGSRGTGAVEARDGADEEEELDDGEEVPDEDYESEYSEDEEENTEAKKKQGKVGEEEALVAEEDDSDSSGEE